MATQVWLNWKAHDAGQPEFENFDDELQSDQIVVGPQIEAGPIRLTPIIRDPGPVGSALVVTSGIHADLAPEIVVDGKLAKANSSGYHGGTMGDELAALISLELGVRMRWAGTSRLSGLHTNEPPRGGIYFEVPRLTRPGMQDSEILPRAVDRPADLGALSRVPNLGRVAPAAHVELVRAARSYADGLWWANEDPNQAWLKLVTAIEIAAKQRQLSATTNVDLVRERWGALWSTIEVLDDETKQSIADFVAPPMQATKTFIEFVDGYAPAPPERRPSSSEVDWSKMRKHAELVYKYRSTLLHGGKPFPPPMLEVPRKDENGIFQEAPWGLNMGSRGGVWDQKETPMLLATFEYVVRGALLRWWDELLAGTSLP